ncbi:hypothetical protein [Streptomyces halstedii]|uniref:hypothetical protein n=1 Tax=Streptomyces halstedii TaxID=1944 RepID=UPI003353C93A
MPKVLVQFHEGSQVKASFEGVVDPKGADGYVFSGTLRATCLLDRSSTDFENMVEFGHGGTSGEYTYLEYRPKGDEENVWTVEGEGKRLKNEPVDLRIGMNTGLSGQFHYGEKVTATPGGPPQKIDPWFRHRSRDVDFEGTAWADGPTGYVIQGRLSSKMHEGSWESEKITFGYKTSSGSWEYKTESVSSNYGVDIAIRGSRKEGDGLQMIVGTTSGTFNRYEYGDEVSCSLPSKF